MNREEINHAIAELENGSTSMCNIEKLAVLYTVRNNMEPSAEPMARIATESEADDEGSEFTQAAHSVSNSKLINVMNAHMDAIKVLYPKEYNHIMQMLLE